MPRKRLDSVFDPRHPRFTLVESQREKRRRTFETPKIEAVRPSGPPSVLWPSVETCRGSAECRTDAAQLISDQTFAAAS